MMPMTAIPRPAWASVMPKLARGRPASRDQASASGSRKADTLRQFNKAADDQPRAKAIPTGASHGPDAFQASDAVPTSKATAAAIHRRAGRGKIGALPGEKWARPARAGARAGRSPKVRLK